MRAPHIRLGRFDRRLRAESATQVLIGVDEVGRGSLAGPVVAAAVVLPEGARLRGLDDSKNLPVAERVRLADEVRSCALTFAFAFVGPRRIDDLNIRQASLLAMRRSVLRAARRAARRLTAPGLVLVDGLDTIPGLDLPQRAIIDGDATSLSVAAASVLAKTVRDGFMTRLGEDFPAYGFERHKGYGTPEHLEALERTGPCLWHRFSFAPVAQPSLFPV
jgi:ribonuclease HII